MKDGGVVGRAEEGTDETCASLSRVANSSIGMSLGGSIGVAFECVGAVFEFAVFFVGRCSHCFNRVKNHLDGFKV